MQHNFIQIEDSESTELTLFQKDNNLDKLDNLNDLPQEAAIFVICGKVNGQAANPRYVGLAKNLREQIKLLFTEGTHHQSPCLREFMLSIKTKHILYKTVQEDISTEGSLNLKRTWEILYRPDCNDEMNKIH